MAIYYKYDQTIHGAQTTTDGLAIDYGKGPSKGDAWQYTGEVFTHVVFEADDSAVIYNGDDENETVNKDIRIGAGGEQSTRIDGTQRAILYDYTFEVSDGTNTYKIAVLDADLNSDRDLQDAAEDGFYLIFIGDIPPPDTALTVANPDASNRTNVPHADIGGKVVCFAQGTLIETNSGPVPVEKLVVGDLVLTRDHDYQPIRWKGTNHKSAAELKKYPNLRPIRIHRAALGKNIPSADLVVSPQHRILLRSRIAQRMFGAMEVLVPAKSLLELDGIEIAEDMTEVTYYHFLLDRHEIVISNGAATESLYTGPEALRSVNSSAHEEIIALFPELNRRDPKTAPLAARPLIKNQKGRKLAIRHVKNRQCAVLPT